MKSLFTESAGTLPSRAGRSRAGLQLPLRAQAATSPLADAAATREWGEHGGSSTRTAEELDRSFTPGTAWAHQTDTLRDQKHGRDSTVLRLLPFNHSFTGDCSHSTSSLSSITQSSCLCLHPHHKGIHSCD